MEAQSNATPSAIGRLERLASFIENRPALGLAGFSVMYFAVAAKLASRRLLWEDEFFTLYLSRLSPGEMWTALLTGADQHPPVFYWLTHLCLSIFGTHHLSIRIPAIFGVWLMCVCIYFIVSHRTSVIYGIAAMIMPLLTYVFFYAYEARGYGPALGFTGLALLGWQQAADGRRRKLGLLALAIGLMLAVSSHYYFGLVVFALSLGELVRSRMTRHLDVPVWLAFASSLLPLVAFLPLIKAARSYSATFWARPYWQQAFDIYEFIGINSSTPVVLLIAFFGIWLACSRPAPADARKGPVIPQYELAAITGLLLVPAIAVFFAIFVTHAFHFRYALSPVIGSAVLAAWIAYALLRGSRTGGLCVVMVGVLGFWVVSWRAWTMRGREVAGVSASLELLNAIEEKSIPIAVTTVTTFYQLSFYAPRSLANRIVYPADPASSVKFIKHDTMDRGLLALQPWFPLNTLRYDDLMRMTPGFFNYGDFTEWSWQTWRFTQERLQLQMFARDRGFVLLYVSKPGAAPAPPRPLPQAPSLALLGVQTAGPSICEQWTQDPLCSVFH